MNVRFYSFSKRRNSTKQPSSTYVVVGCNLKAPTSVHNPVLEIVGGPQSSYNYAYIPDFAKYYFVRDIVSETNGISSYYLEEDVLATHKTEIGNMRAFIAYASTGYDVTQIDSRIALKQTKTMSGSTSNAIFNGGAYYLTVFNDNGGASTGFCQTYQLNESAMSDIRDWFGDTTIIDAIEQYLHGSPLDAIFTCYWLPHMHVTSGSNNVIHIGNQQFSTWSSGSTCHLISGWAQDLLTINLAIPAIYTDYRKYEPYTTGFVYLPGIGNVDVKLSDYTTNINISYTLEVLTGNVTYLFFNDAGALVQTAVGNVASQSPIGKIEMSGGKLVSSIAQIAGGVGMLAAGLGTGGAAGAAVAVSGAASAFTGTANTILAANTHGPCVTGQFGGRGSLLWPYVNLTVVATDTEDPDDLNYIAEKGRPVGIVNGIGSYSGGYVQTIDAHIDCTGSEEERTEIENYLNSGIYYE